MHIAYSAISNKKTRITSARSARYDGYHAACQKHEQTIADIRRYMPDWEPHLAVGSEQYAVSRPSLTVCR